MVRRLPKYKNNIGKKERNNNTSDYKFSSVFGVQKAAGSAKRKHFNNTIDYNAISSKFNGQEAAPQDLEYNYSKFDIEAFEAENDLSNEKYTKVFLDFVKLHSGDKVLDIPQCIGNFIVDKIPAGSLKGKPFETINFPSTLKIILENACFMMPKLSKIVIPEGVLVIEKAAFSNCPKLQEVYLPESLEYIGNYAFDECDQLSYVKMPLKVSTIRAYAFSDTAIESIVVPEVEYLGNSCFFNCKRLKEVSFAGPVECIGNCSFQACSQLTRIALPEGLKTIYRMAFANCTSLKMVELPSTLQEINKHISFLGMFGIKEHEENNSAQYNSFGNCPSIVAVTMQSKDIYNKEFCKGEEKFVFPTMPIFMNFDGSQTGRERYELLKSKISQASLSEKEQIEHYIYYGSKEKSLGYIGNAIRLYLDALSLKANNGVAQYNIAKALYLSGNIEAAMKGLLFAINNVGREKNKTVYGLFNKFYNQDTEPVFIDWLRDPLHSSYVIDAVDWTEGIERIKTELLANQTQVLEQNGVSLEAAERAFESNVEHYKITNTLGYYDDESKTLSLQAVDELLYPNESLNRDNDEASSLKIGSAKVQNNKSISKDKVVKIFGDNSIAIEHYSDNSFKIEYEPESIDKNPELFVKKLIEALFADSVKDMSIDDALNLCDKVKPCEQGIEKGFADLMRDYDEKYIKKAQENYKELLTEYNSKESSYSSMEKRSRLTDLGVAAKRAGYYQEAIRHYMDTIDIDPNVGNPYYAIGKLMYLSKKYDEAVKSYTLAYIDNCSQNINDIYRHCGFAYIAGLSHYAKKYKTELEQYKRSISGLGIVSDINSELHDACEVVGKAVLGTIKTEYERAITESL